MQVAGAGGNSRQSGTLAAKYCPYQREGRFKKLLYFVMLYCLKLHVKYLNKFQAQKEAWQLQGYQRKD